MSNQKPVTSYQKKFWLLPSRLPAGGDWYLVTSLSFFLFLQNHRRALPVSISIGVLSSRSLRILRVTFFEYPLAWADGRVRQEHYPLLNEHFCFCGFLY